MKKYGGSDDAVFSVNTGLQSIANHLRLSTDGYDGSSDVRTVISFSFQQLDISVKIDSTTASGSAPSILQRLLAIHQYIHFDLIPTLGSLPYRYDFAACLTRIPSAHSAAFSRALIGSRLCKSKYPWMVAIDTSMSAFMIVLAKCSAASSSWTF